MKTVTQCSPDLDAPLNSPAVEVAFDNGHKTDPVFSPIPTPRANDSKIPLAAALVPDSQTLNDCSTLVLPPYVLNFALHIGQDPVHVPGAEAAPSSPSRKAKKGNVHRDAPGRAPVPRPAKQERGEGATAPRHKNPSPPESANLDSLSPSRTKEEDSECRPRTTLLQLQSRRPRCTSPAGSDTVTSEGPSPKKTPRAGRGLIRPYNCDEKENIPPAPALAVLVSLST
ncbi:hypothetical protein B0H15DRAFT_368635 [Mycena belliarum]|uniref:Uncharacterized protein n=1 Tax=Mycena belliarum TaxID=1033014 RepID=A0AAD6XKY2_9AGAR|nr:hypothetical protein B0H15DRAFT_368635 [Mycena belliae]